MVTLSCLWPAASVSALAVPPKPARPIVDQTNTLKPEQIAALEQTILNEEKTTGNQIGVLIIKSLEGQPIENYSIDVARQWGIGGSERNSGVLLLIAKNDRKLRIEVGYGLEGALPDIRAGQIIRDRISPEFKKGNYFSGIQSGLDGIIKAIHGEKDTVLKANTGSSGFSIPWEFILFGLFFIPSWIGAMLARTKSWWAGGVVGAVVGVILGFIFGFLFIGIISIVLFTGLGLLLDRAVSANYQRRTSRGNAPSWWAGGPYIGSGRNDSGGWGGFSGGSFGGGGAGGDW